MHESEGWERAERGSLAAADSRTPGWDSRDSRAGGDSTSRASLGL